MSTLTPSETKARLAAADEIAFIDVREAGQHGEGHPLLAVPMPFSRLEAEARRLLPCRSVPIVLVDDGDGIAARAGERLRAVGYGDIALLAGGAPGWAAAGFGLFKGVNVPSKAFGELVEHALGTPRVSADELAARRAAGEDLVILDGRTPGEFRRMSIPGARSCPNAELPYRFFALVPSPTTTVVVNCAGRTRSIIGAENLRAAGVPNPVLALENGTQGWRLSGRELEHGRTPESPPALDEPARRRAEERGRELRAAHHIPQVDRPTLAAWRRDGSRTLHVLDVRTAEEFAAGHLPGAAHAPGGQLVQSTDRWVAVRGARIVLCDDAGLRAAITARWLRAMGHDARVLDADVSGLAGGDLAAGESAASPLADEIAFPTVPAERLMERLAAGAELLDLSPSMDYRAAHVLGARWATRARLERLGLATIRETILTGRDRDAVALAAADLRAAGHARLAFLTGEPQAWRAAGLDVVATPSDPPDAECIDFLFFVHDRHSGNLDAARAYLAWETGLVGQLDAEEAALLDPVKFR